MVNAVIAVEPGAGLSKTTESVKTKAVIHAAALVLERLWGEAFDACYAKSLTGIKKHIKCILVKYASFMKHRNNKGKSKREKNKLWRLQNSVLFNCFSRNMNEKKLEELENFDVENFFYIDQTGPRLMYLDEEIDKEYANKRTAWLNQQKKEAEKYESEMKYIFDDENDDTTEVPTPDFQQTSSSTQPSTDNHSSARATRSGLILSSNNLVSTATQVDFHYAPQPPTRKIKVCTDDICLG